MYMSMIVSTLLALAIFSQTDADYKFPVEPCKRSHPNISECWAKQLLPYLSSTVKNFGMTSVDPWKSPTKFITDTEEFHLEESNLEFAGASKFYLLNNNVDLDKNYISMTMQFPKLIANCTTIGTGKLVGYELGGPSRNQLQACVRCGFEFRGKRKIKNGREYINYDDINIECHGNYKKLVFPNFVSGSRKDNENFARELAKHPEIVVPHMNKCIEHTLATDIANAIVLGYKTFPFDVVHPM